MSICCIIPARYNSSRLPGKPLLKINKKELLLLTYNNIKKVFKEEDIYIFTDSKKVAERFKNLNIFFFRKSFINGAERASYGLKFIKKKYEAALVLSCDNPCLEKKAVLDTLNTYLSIKKDDQFCAGTVHCKRVIKKNDRNIAKVVLNEKNDIMYLSRNQIPSQKINNKYLHTHHGPVCVKIKYLKKYFKLKNTYNQITEDNEWLKFIDHGYKIKSMLTKNISQEVNVKKDLNFYIKNFR